MPTTFGTQYKQVRLVDPRDARRYRERFRRDAIKELEYANSLYVPIGRNSSRGWILLTRKDYDLVRSYDTTFRLTIDQFSKQMPALTFLNLAIVQARCVTTGLASSPEAVYLAELTDARGVYVNRWFKFPVESYYNVLSPAYPALYYSESLNAGSAYTWSTLVQSLWQQMPLLGTFPGLPSAPSGTPTNLNLAGVSAWDVLSDILDHLGMAVSVDLTSATPYGIVSLGSTDAVFDALVLLAFQQGRLQDDLEWIDTGAGRVPGTMIVYFRRVNEQYGTEETVRRDSSQWATNAVYSVNVSAPATFSGAPGTGYLWDDFPVRYDVNNAPLAADVITAAAIAAERVTQYYDLIYSRTAGYMNRTYAGVLPFYAGSQVDGVCWRQDFMDVKRTGWTTQIMRGDLWRGIYDENS